MPRRCDWAEGNDLLRHYHDTEWGVPLRDDHTLFEYMVLDAFQAGLSWAIILKKREGFRAAFHGFDPEAIAHYGPRDVRRLLKDEGIIRNRQKIEATIGNARAYLDLQREFGTAAEFLWSFVGGRPKQNAWRTRKQVPATSPESDAMSKALRSRGFRFVGSTICYAFMQAAGMVNDHVTDCFRYRQVARAVRP
ncbi:MAG TPA: DNA-3-methyladenine glycosylase I [Longimicrobiales bacterium]